MYDFRQYGDRLLIYTESDVYAISKAGLIPKTASVRKDIGLITEGVHYGIDGRLVAPEAPGFHIIRMPDGRIRKVYVPSKR